MITVGNNKGEGFMKNKTSKEFYDKYEKMNRQIVIGTLNESIARIIEKVGGIDGLRKKYEEDKNLNNIKMSCFDCYYPGVRKILVEENPCFSLAENVCLYKHVLIYDVLKMEPEHEG